MHSRLLGLALMIRQSTPASQFHPCFQMNHSMSLIEFDGMKGSRDFQVRIPVSTSKHTDRDGAVLPASVPMGIQGVPMWMWMIGQQQELVWVCKLSLAPDAAASALFRHQICGGVLFPRSRSGWWWHCIGQVMVLTSKYWRIHVCMLCF